MASYTQRTTKNPNEKYKGGARACSAVGQQKHPDCSGQWVELLAVTNNFNNALPHVVICEYHLRELAGVKPRPVRRQPPAPTLDTELSL